MLFLKSIVKVLGAHRSGHTPHMRILTVCVPVPGLSCHWCCCQHTPANIGRQDAELRAKERGRPGSPRAASASPHDVSAHPSEHGGKSRAHHLSAQVESRWENRTARGCHLEPSVTVSLLGFAESGFQCVGQPCVSCIRGRILF